MMKKRLLVCMPDLPFPARKNGISIRYYPIIVHASAIFDIHLLVISNGDGKSDIDIEGLHEAKKYCTNISVYHRKPKKVNFLTKLYARAKTLLPVTTPFTELRYDEAEIASFIKTKTQGQEFDVALCVLIPYQSLIKKIVTAKQYTLDVIDSPYSTIMRTAGNSPLKRYDALMVKLWERRVLKSVDRACYISPLDRQLGAGKNIDEQKIAIIPNGLFLHDHTEEKKIYGCPTIGYLGHMGYPPNIKAALRLYSIFQARRNELPNTKLVIIGRDPAAAITVLSQDPNVIVTGTVDNIWPYVNGIDLFAFPMEIGSGQQNKLLEAMGAGKLVISSTLGNSGIGARNQHELIEANSDTEIGDALVRFTHDPVSARDIGKRAQDFTERTYSWPSILNKIDQHLLNIH